MNLIQVFKYWDKFSSFDHSKLFELQTNPRTSNKGKQLKGSNAILTTDPLHNCNIFHHLYCCTLNATVPSMPQSCPASNFYKASSVCPYRPFMVLWLEHLPTNLRTRVQFQPGYSTWSPPSSSSSHSCKVGAHSKLNMVAHYLHNTWLWHSHKTHI